jgi:hypothetical protein
MTTKSSANEEKQSRPDKLSQARQSIPGKLSQSYNNTPTKVVYIHSPNINSSTVLPIQAVFPEPDPKYDTISMYRTP